MNKLIQQIDEFVHLQFPKLSKKVDQVPVQTASQVNKWVCHDSNSKVVTYRSLNTGLMKERSKIIILYLLN